jgi:Arc/MetJ family transcription regulator
MRTNIAIDDELLMDAMAATGKGLSRCTSTSA